jgi:hypothetical protein
MHAFPFMADPVRTFMTATLAEFEKILGKGVTGEPINLNPAVERLWRWRSGLL